MTPETRCPKCGGIGYWIDKETNTTYACDCGSATLDFERRLKRAGVPRRFRHATFESFQAPKGDKVRQEVRQAAESFAATVSLDEPEGLIMRGPPGSGKTHLAVAVIRAVVARGLTGYFTNFNDLLTEIRNSYHPDYPVTEEEVLRPLEENDFVVLDDLGAETPKEFVRDRLYLIVNRRYEAGKPLVITTNFDEAELETRLGVRTISRLYEMCSQSFPPFPSVDVRKHGLPEKQRGRRSSSSGSDPRRARME